MGNSYVVLNSRERNHLYHFVRSHNFTLICDGVEQDYEPVVGNKIKIRKGSYRKFLLYKPHSRKIAYLILVADLYRQGTVPDYHIRRGVGLCVSIRDGSRSEHVTDVVHIRAFGIDESG